MSKTRKDGNHRRLEPREGSVKQRVYDRLTRNSAHALLHELSQATSSLEELDDYNDFPSFEKM